MNSKVYLKLIFVFFSFFILFTGCGGSEVMIDPNYNSIHLQIDTLKDQFRIAKVVDNRKNQQPTNAGIAQVGMFNKKVPYILTEPVTDFVKKALNKIIIDDENRSQLIPVTVIVDTFKVYERMTPFNEAGFFESNLRFIYPVSDDSIKTIKTFSLRESGGIDVTNSLERLMYEGVAECADQFLQHLSNEDYLSLESFSNLETREIDSISIDQIIKSDTLKISESSKKKNLTNLGLNYSSGDKIKTGFQFTYQLYDTSKTNNKFQDGFGYSFTFYDIENIKDNIQGNFINLGYRYSLKYYLLPSKKGIYFGGSVKLSFGTETIEYGYNSKKTNFFFGPTFEETIGLSIQNRVFLEAGLFQVKLFGSDILPDDLGYSMGIGIGF